MTSETIIGLPAYAGKIRFLSPETQEAVYF